MTEQKILIKSNSRKHNIFLRVLSLFILLVTLIIAAENDYKFNLPLMLMTLVSIVLFTIGTLKALEPEFSYILKPEGICYNHKYGQWFIGWDNIQRVSQVKHTYGLDEEELPYIGFRLKNLEEVFNKISPRLASRLVHEQRDIYIASLLQKDNMGELNAINLAPYKCANGVNITGPIACWMHRAKELNQFLGYDIYVPISSFDVKPDDFVDLINECKKASVNY